jgi:hypothetical protein
MEMVDSPSSTFRIKQSRTTSWALPSLRQTKIFFGVAGVVYNEPMGLHMLQQSTHLSKINFRKTWHSILEMFSSLASLGDRFSCLDSSFQLSERNTRPAWC